MAKHPPILQRFWKNYVWDSNHRSINNPNVPLSDLTPDFFGLNKGNASGQSVTEKTALKLAAVYRADRLLRDTIASLPLDVYEKQSNGAKSVAIDHDVNYLLGKEPNPLQTSFTWRDIMQGSLNMKGNALSIIHRKGTKPDRLEWIPQEKVEAKTKNQKAYYNYKIDEKSTKRYKGTEIIHIPNYSQDGFWGLGVLEIAAEAIGSGLGQQKFTAELVKNNAQPSTVLIGKGSMTAEQKADNKKNWQSAHGGGKHGGVAVLGGDWDLKTFSITPEQAQMLESKKFGVIEIARFFGVEPHLLFELDRATYSNIEHQGIEFVTYTIRGIVKRWEQELNRKLFTEEEKRSGKYFCKFNLNGLMRADAKSRAEYYNTLFGISGIKPAEIRDLEGLNKEDAPDEFFIASNNYTRINDLDKNPNGEE